MPPVKKEKPKKKVQTPNKKNVSAENAAISVQLNKKLKQREQKEKKQRGVVFIKHLPHGFFEEQLKNYFGQFGNVTRLRLARSKRSGGSKGYAFIEFEYPEVAQVAAETMDNYLMFQKIVKAQYIPPEKQRFNFFKSTVRQVKDKTGKNIYVSCTTANIRRKAKQHNDWSDVNYQKRTATKLKKINKLNKKYAHLGIDFSKIIVGPKIINASDQTNESNEEIEKVEKDKVAATSSNSKRKLTADNKKIAEKTKKQKNVNESLKLEDLLGNTLNDDSNDEDYVANAKDEDTSDEDSYGFLAEDDNESLKTEDLLGNTLNDDSDDEDYVAIQKDTSHENDDDDDDDNNNSSDELNESHEPLVKLKKNKKNEKPLAKSLKTKRTDPFEQLIKRKPLSGGIKKTGKKNRKAPTVLKPKNMKMLKAAKELAKPLKTIKNKKIKTKNL
ncbi:MKI67 FHA domain-interacting nucleolar phosphoprotein-like [Teleopsis dalmanni]|uniref:MKI67 FHA domain-interacting nucleolar phosphoprotein-like n=1 Tax=Teleopsis dalmanni TaxID=139649 RepID=UPI0018CEAB8D|nr:MKI67 FHA domain-interacting nucleolar phosphoprotein-like [Teleopsis dalmanni]